MLDGVDVTRLPQAANGALVRTNYAKEGNSMTVVFGGGRSDNGTWTAEDGRICLEMRTIPSACNDLRIIGGDFHLRRSNGEIVESAVRLIRDIGRRPATVEEARTIFGLAPAQAALRPGRRA